MEDKLIEETAQEINKPKPITARQIKEAYDKVNNTGQRIRLDYCEKMAKELNKEGK